MLLPKMAPAVALAPPPQPRPPPRPAPPNSRDSIYRLPGGGAFHSHRHAIGTRGGGEAFKTVRRTRTDSVWPTFFTGYGTTDQFSFPGLHMALVSNSPPPRQPSFVVQIPTPFLASSSRRQERPIEHGRTICFRTRGGGLPGNGPSQSTVPPSRAASPPPQCSPLDWTPHHTRRPPRPLRRQRQHRCQSHEFGPRVLTTPVCARMVVWCFVARVSNYLPYF